MESNADVWGHLEMAPPDPILSSAQAWRADPNPMKVNLGVGVYRTEEEKPYVFEVVREVEAQMFAEKLDHEYLPIEGLAKFNENAQKLLFGADHPLVLGKKICTVQALSGTGALRVGMEFLRTYSPGDVYLSAPTWGNHVQIAKKAGLSVFEYPYFDPVTQGLCWPKLIECLGKAKPNSIVVLHVCAHNPTGVDPTLDQWKALAALMKEKKLFPFFDSAYQGYASGDLERDVQPVKIFLNEGLQMIVAQGLAKNFGLYGERIGALHFVCNSKEVAEKVLSQVKLVIRPMYSNPPMNGARIVSRILESSELTARWKKELLEVSLRIQKMRVALREQLERVEAKGKWDHITSQIGMFSYTGLTEQQCLFLIEKYHIYLLKNGRISMSGVNTKNVEYIAKAIKEAVEAHPKL